MTFRLMLTLSWTRGTTNVPFPRRFSFLCHNGTFNISCERRTYESVDAKSLSSAVTIEIGSYGVNIHNTTILEPFFSRFFTLVVYNAQQWPWSPVFSVSLRRASRPFPYWNLTDTSQFSQTICPVSSSDHRRTS